jgi:hypothetical protein
MTRLLRCLFYVSLLVADLASAAVERRMDAHRNRRV